MDIKVNKIPGSKIQRLYSLYEELMQMDDAAHQLIVECDLIYKQRDELEAEIKRLESSLRFRARYA